MLKKIVYYFNKYCCCCKKKKKTYFKNDVQLLDIDEDIFYFNYKHNLSNNKKNLNNEKNDIYYNCYESYEDMIINKKL